MLMLFVIVVMMFMLVHVLIFFDTQCYNACVGAFDTAFDGLFEVICDIGNSQ